MVYAGSLLLAAGMLLSGCSDDHQAGTAAWAGAAADTTSQVIAVDVSGQGTVKVTGLPQGITALTAADTPRVVLLGTDFVRQHGTVPNGGKLPQYPRQNGLQQPIVAMVEGAADVFMVQASPAEWLPELQRMDGSLIGFQHRTDGRRRDTIVPYINYNGTTSVQVRAAVLRGREPALLLKEQELELLACLDGQAVASGGRSMSCRTEWSSNGDLKAPRINTVVTVTLKPGDPMLLNRKAAEAGMTLRMNELMYSLQLQGADPLDIGQTVRSLYRGVWTQERWRQAFSHAHLGIQIRLTS
ncbi:MAG: spore germination protein GerAC [Paenibacillus sp.]|nr:spore germination protein GerAC [Paenibacillus sp.]